MRLESGLLELTSAVSQFASDRQPFVIEGGATKLQLGRLLPESLPRLKTTGYSGILAYEPHELTLRARAGTKITELKEILASKGQMLGFEPPHFNGDATLGGTIATGLSGARRPWCGSARDFVLGVGLITAGGEYLEFGGQVMKNVAGFDVSRLVTGAYGTLGVIADVSLKVLPKPANEVTLTLNCERSRAHDLMLAFSNASSPLSGASQIGDQLFLRFSGSSDAVRSVLTDSRLKGARETSDDSLGELASFKLPKALDDGEQPLWRISLAAASPAFLQESQAIDWGGAQRFVLGADYESGRLPDGHLSCIRAASARIEQPFAALTGPVREIHERLKGVFDPDRLINPGKMYEGL